MGPNWKQLKVQGVKLRESEVQGGISKRLVVQGGLVKFPLNIFIVHLIDDLLFEDLISLHSWLEDHVHMGTS
jgi:hypothetical protein